MLATHACLLVHIPDEYLLMIRVWSNQSPISWPALETIDLTWVYEYFVDLKSCLLFLQLLLVCTRVLRAATVASWFGCQSASSGVLIELITLPSYVNFSNCKEGGSTAKPSLVVVSIVVREFISSGSEEYLLPYTGMLFMNCRSPSTTRHEVEGPILVIEIVKTMLASITECLILMEYVTSVHLDHFFVARSIKLQCL